MRKAREVLTLWLIRKVMISRTAFCSFHAALIRARRIGPMPSTSSSRADWFSMIFSTSRPNALTSLPA